MTATYQADLLSPDKEYNGWTNYETWNVGLWLGGDEGLYDHDVPLIMITYARC